MTISWVGIMVGTAVMSCDKVWGSRWSQGNVCRSSEEGGEARSEGG